MAVYEPKSWLLSFDFFHAFPTKASPGIQFCSFSLSFCPNVSNWRWQTCLLPSSPLSPWQTWSITLGQTMSQSLHNLCFLLCCFQGPSLQTIFFPSEYQFEITWESQNTLAFLLFFSIPLMVRLLSLSFKFWKKKKQKSHTFPCICLSLICKKTFIQCINIYNAERENKQQNINQNISFHSTIVRLN